MVMLCHGGGLSVADISLRSNNDTVLERFSVGGIRCTTSAAQIIARPFSDKLVYLCQNNRYLQIRGTGKGSQLVSQDFNQTVFPYSDIIANGSEEIHTTLQRQNVGIYQAKLEPIKTLKVLGDNILILSTSEDFSRAHMYLVNYTKGTIQHIFHKAKLVDDHPMDVAMFNTVKGPIFFYMSTLHLIYVLSDGIHNIVTQSLRSGHLMVAISSVDVILTQHVNALDHPGKLIHIDTISGDRETICHSKSDNPGQFTECGIRKPRHLALLNGSQLLVIDDSLHLTLLLFTGKLSDQIVDEVVLPSLHVGSKAVSNHAIC